MPRGEGVTPNRALRIPGPLWSDAKRVAALRGETVTSAVIRFLRRYVSSYPLDPFD